MHARSHIQRFFRNMIFRCFDQFWIRVFNKSSIFSVTETKLPLREGNKKTIVKNNGYIERKVGERLSRPGGACVFTERKLLLLYETIVPFVFPSDVPPPFLSLTQRALKSTPVYGTVTDALPFNKSHSPARSSELIWNIMKRNIIPLKKCVSLRSCSQ